MKKQSLTEGLANYEQRFCYWTREKAWGTHASFSQSRDDVSQRRQGLVDVLGLVEHGSLCSRFTDLRDRTKCLKTYRIRNKLTQIKLKKKKIRIHSQAAAYNKDRLFALIFLYLFTTSQIHQVEFAAQLLLRLSVLLFDVYQEDAVTPGAVLIHVYKETNDGREVKNVMVATTVKSFLTEQVAVQ